MDGESTADGQLPELTFAGLVTAWDTSPALVTATVGPEHRVAYQNAASRRVVGELELGAPFARLFPHQGARTRELMDRVLRDGDVVEVGPGPVGTRDAAGRPMSLQYVFAPLGEVGDGRSPVGVVLTGIDVTAQTQAEAAARQSRLLAELSERMNASADPDRALQTMTETLVPAVGDLAAVYVLPTVEPAGLAPEQRRAASAAAAMTVAADLHERLGPPPQSDPQDEPSPWTAVLASGQTVLMDVSAAGTVAEAPGAEAPTEVGEDPGARWLREARAKNIAIVPLLVGGELAGAVLLLAAGERPAYTQDDVPFLELAAARAGAVVSHLRSFRQHRQIALDLQRALLPATPARLPAARVAARYVAGSVEVEIGGDWWDVHDLGGGRTGVGVGDVSGRGLQAAVVMGQARSAMRAAAHADLAPGALLRLLDAMVTELVEAPGDGAQAPPRFATAAYAVVDHGAGSLRVANAGHVPLLVRRPDGVVQVVQAPPGPPLGLSSGDFEEIEVPFPQGSVLVAFTDGLVESRNQPVDEGVAELSGYVAALDAGCDLDVAADRLLDDMGRGAGHDDDVALVLLRAEP